MAGLFALLALLPVGYSALVAGDFTQLIYKPSHRQLYLVYRYRMPIVASSIGLWLIALALHLWVAPTNPVWLGIALVLVLFLAATAFFAVPFTLFTGIRNGQWVTATEAETFLTPDTPMLTVVVNGDARAASIRWMNRIHFWEDTVGGETVNLSFCPLSNTTVAVKPELDGQKLNLIVPSQLENNLVMYDTNTGSLIQQIDASVREGTHKGSILETYPSQIMTWAAWKALHPETKVLQAAPSNLWEKFVLSLVGMVIKRHRGRNQPFFPTIDRLDTRLSHTVEVIGLTANGTAKAYTMDYVCDAGVVNADVGGQPVVIVCDKTQDTQFVYSREYDGQTLTFEPVRDGATLQLQDNTGRTWKVSGQAVDGAGQLAPVTYMSRAFWFTWANFHPTTELIGA